MPRYFVEVAYKGTGYSGFQIQQNANSVQAEVEKALKIFFKQDCNLTGASRTDTGVHALQNYFHFDIKNLNAFTKSADLQRALYSLNALMPPDIVVKKIAKVPDNVHCRFDATSRQYKYYIYRNKNPFLQDRAYYFPFTLDIEKLNAAADALQKYNDFTSFCKRNTQVKNFQCNVYTSNWALENEVFTFNITANRFLRGMVRGIVGTMLKVGTGKVTLEDFCNVIKSRDCAQADFSVPAHGLFLVSVKYPFNI